MPMTMGLRIRMVGRRSGRTLALSETVFVTLHAKGATGGPVTALPGVPPTAPTSPLLADAGGAGATADFDTPASTKKYMSRPR